MRNGLENGDTGREEGLKATGNRDGGSSTWDTGVAVYGATVKYLICLNSVGKGGGVEGLNCDGDALRQRQHRTMIQMNGGEGWKFWFSQATTLKNKESHS